MKKVKKLPFKEFKYIYEKVPRICVDLIIKDKDGIVLSLRDIPPAKGYWHFPGGTILWNEKITDTAKRVAKEETGLSIKIEDILGVIEYSNTYAFGQSISIALLVTPISGKLTGSAQGKKVVSFNKIPLKTIPDQAKFLLKNKLINA